MHFAVSMDSVNSFCAIMLFCILLTHQQQDRKLNEIDLLILSNTTLNTSRLKMIITCKIDVASLDLNAVDD